MYSAITSREKKAELYKLAAEDKNIMRLLGLFNSDNAPWWAFSQLVDNEAALLELDKVIPSAFDEDRIEAVHQALASSCWYLDDIVNDAFLDVFGRSIPDIRGIARRVAVRACNARALK